MALTNKVTVVFVDMFYKFFYAFGFLHLTLYLDDHRIVSL
jgi:hypothetical protein